MSTIKLVTLCFVCTEKQVLLGLKKRGFGAGWWNGFGGKVLPNETIQQAARRELLEECGINAIELKKRGNLRFHFADDERAHEMHIFTTDKFSGMPRESEEMRPQWFDYNNLPYDQMWESDSLWLPRLWRGEDIAGKCHFDSGKRLTWHSFDA
ncbi:MAG: 8-oxo-dGTP diphosphatase [bacterium]|nr:8-oxo-dGTP diphosphatase [bacterium]